MIQKYWLWGFFICAAIVGVYWYQLLGSKDYNVVIFTFDGLQARHLSAYGYSKDTTPNLDVFFKDSYLFTNAVSAAPWTVPSFMSIFTSRYPSEHNLTNKLVAIETATTTHLVQANVQTLIRHKDIDDMRTHFTYP